MTMFGRKDKPTFDRDDREERQAAAEARSRRSKRDGLMTHTRNKELVKRESRWSTPTDDRRSN